ncbi:FAD binding domain-containing protein [Penicillium diatomitis]|uniref:FAD binding domain-containing protein n=1 Tax=Penicillium diatomitis TaxID=2819901 RepID=A0A9W9X5W6_9EURO|nr:FAD binding domain-containing protein [Penicillium diatomitis]KAJ5484200.1 FAD binding domain-containing protein [Penicillium diatomitis]
MAIEQNQTDRAKKVLVALEPLIRELGSDEVLATTADDYKLHSMTFSVERELHPAVVFVPTSTQSLAKMVNFLYASELDFHVRGQGFKSASSSDVLISLLKFKSFEYDPVNKLAVVGVGATWAEVAHKMREADPHFVLNGARTPSVGVGGAILHGGYSWMASEFGCIADPINFLDAEVVKYDGRVVKASEEPSLLWALRGSGGGFGIMTKVFLRAHYYPTKIWTGMILVPKEELVAVAQQIAEFVSKPQHPKISVMMYSVRYQLLHTILNEHDLKAVNGDMIAIHVYDACGERHGREAFSWALDIPGAIDRTTVVDMKGVVDMQQNAAFLKGTMKNFRAVPMSIPDVSADHIIRALKWQEKIKSVDEAIHDRTMMIFEFFVLSPPIGGQAGLAWPRRLDDKHYLLVLTGSPADGTAEQEQKAREVAIKTPEEIFGESNQDYTILPAGLDELHDPKKASSMSSNAVLMISTNISSHPCRRTASIGTNLSN